MADDPSTSRGSRKTSLPFPVRFQPKMPSTEQQVDQVRKVRLGSDPLALYVHVPFCVTRCYFCDFVTVVGKSVTPELIDRYARALNTELDFYAEDSTFGAAPFETAQLGGGTPTMLSPRQLDDVLARMRHYLRGNPDAEILVEGFPTSVTPDKLEVLRSAGNIKFNMGVQTFNDEVLEAVGRRHEREDAMRAITQSKQAGLPSVGIDLIYGLPGGGTDVIAADVRTALDFEVDHIALYPLWVYPQTRLNSLIETGRRSSTEFMERQEQLLVADSMLRAAGFERYTSFHYSRGPEHHHQYGLWQMRGQDWLGVGQAAASQLNDVVYENDRNINRYVALADTCAETAVTADHMNHRARMVRHLSYGIRERRYLLHAFEARFGSSPHDVFGPEIEWMVAEELVDSTPDHLELTLQGILRLGDIEEALAPADHSVAEAGTCCG
ncbi:coproporphyrinogen-III oxidase family protein [Nonomuraea sp. NPDC050643]|uniref:coproporphyrinogen-III oxidase family protein n=1 Tax=Nonomuraea sp. NPDC050643 TaxID=3155660 RepID=UPI0033FB9947